MPIDTDRLVLIANELNTLEQQREQLVAELQRIAGGGAPSAPRRGRPPLSWAPARAAPASRRRGRPPGSRNQVKPVAKPAAPAPGRKPRKGLTTDVVGLLAGGGAFTAGDIVEKLGLQPRKRKISTVGATLFRLVKEGRVKKDKVRGYRATSGRSRAEPIAGSRCAPAWFRKCPARWRSEPALSVPFSPWADAAARNSRALEAMRAVPGAPAGP